MGYSVKIPMKAHLARFLHFRLQIGENQPFHLSQKCPIMAHLILLFTTKTKCTFDGLSNGGDESWDAVIRVQLTSKNQKYGEIFLDNQRIRRWNQYVHYKLHEYLDTRISMYQLHGIDIKDAIWDFIHEADMEDLITFDALKKSNYRLRRARVSLQK